MWDRYLLATIATVPFIGLYTIGLSHNIGLLWVLSWPIVGAWLAWSIYGAGAAFNYLMVYAYSNIKTRFRNTGS